MKNLRRAEMATISVQFTTTRDRVSARGGKTSVVPKFNDWSLIKWEIVRVVNCLLSSQNHFYIGVFLMR